MIIVICNVPNGDPSQHGTTCFLILVLTLNNTLDTTIIETECDAGRREGADKQISTRRSVDIIIHNGLRRPGNVIRAREMRTFLSSPLIFWLSGGHKVMTHARCVLIIITRESLAPGLRRHRTLDAITVRIIAAGKSDLMSTFHCTLMLHIVREKKGGGGNPRLSCFFPATV